MALKSLLPDNRPEGGVPLVVDLDGTLIRGDLVIEAALAVLAADFRAGLRTLLHLARGPAGLAAILADPAAVEAGFSPFDAEALARIRAARAQGRPVYLASAGDRARAEAVARHLGQFDGVVAPDQLAAELGPGSCERLDPGSAPAAAPAAGLRDYVRALRVHQWLKNLLIFVPALAAHEPSVGTWATLVVAFACFSLCASSVYVLNDLCDLRNDREHPTKRRRPFASGAIPLRRGLVMAPVLLLAAMAWALTVSGAFALVLGTYYALTLAYSLKLKRVMMLDVVTLAGLYGIRVLAGGIAVSIELSHWLVGFAVFLFLCLALVKRATELVAKGAAGQEVLAGRAYAAPDLPVVEAMAAAAGFVAVLVLALYVNSAEVRALYASPSILWAACVVLIYWIGRILLLTHRGQMHDDPVVFAVTDRVSLSCGAAMAVIALAGL